MTGTQLQRAREIFEKLVDTPPDQRTSLLAVACKDDAHLRAFVEQLLANDDGGMGEFLETPAYASDCDARESEADWMPQRIGRYEIVRKCGP